VTKRYTRHFWQLSGLQRTLLLYVVLPMLVLSGFAIRFGLEFANELVTDRLESDLELVGRAIRLPISDALTNNDVDAVRATLESVFSIGQVYGASVYDTQGNQVAAAGITEADLSGSVLAEEVVRTGQEQDSFRSVEGRDVYSRFLPIIDRGGRIIGLLQMTRRASDFRQSIEDLAKIAWLSWGAFALATIALLVFGHYRAVGRHVDELVTTMRRVAGGDRQVRAPAQGPNEVVEIAAGLNTMLDSIEVAEQEIYQHRAHEIQLQAELREKEKMAAIGQVASGVAHELGAPLTVIDGRAQRLQRQHADEESQRQLTAVRGQVQRLTRMVRQLLAFSRTPISAYQTIEMTTLMQQAITSLSYELEPEAPELVVTAPATPVTFRGDEQRLELALVNVLRNAVQAAQAQVLIDWQQQSDGLTITIRDDGQGLPEQYGHAEMTRPFVTTKAQGEGTGLGLAIVEYVITDHGGKLSLKNHSQGGCEVHISLPSHAQSKSVGGA